MTVFVNMDMLVNFGFKCNKFSGLHGTTNYSEGTKCVQTSWTLESFKFRAKAEVLEINIRKTISTLSSPEKEDRYYTTRGSTGVGFDESSSSRKVLTMESKKESNNKTVWPRLYTTLSSKEKEEDFMAMKGCKLPQRPKKRAKMIQKTLLLVSPGAWLSDLCQERYEVREKKTSKKRHRGLKAMGGIESDSE